MKYLLLFKIVFLILFNLPRVNAQVKIDTIYYLLDTTKIPIKDRMFNIEREGPFMFYSLECKCFPYGYGIGFYYQIADKKGKKVSVQEFRKLKTVSITQLIDLALKCLATENRSKYQFIIAEPKGDNIILTEMKVWIPSKPRNNSTVTTIEPMKN